MANVMQVVFFFVARLLPILMGSLSLAYVLWAGFDIDLADFIEGMLESFGDGKRNLGASRCPQSEIL